ncbi:DUF6265 family protein [Brevundimonas sp.]|uniref:DUF6265 family protein n=1 Tax=Brevundimonas sp. TaxID=1871086 RepID=UPI0025CFCCBA|nr:DUF6265 family protein [Brevundimonas sp.]
MLISLLAAAQLAAAPASDLNWVAGYWLSCEDGREVAEYWSDARGGALFNTTVNLDGDRVSSERTMFATVNGRLAFVYEPTGANVVFPLIALEGQRAVFENPENDFPNRVIYSREGDVLTGRIEGTIDGQPRSMEWVYQAAELNARCPGT